MSYQVLYRTYRPSKFDEVVGQDYIVKILKNAIKNNKIAHAYLFAGPRGTGKTSVAKLFAKAINCDHFNEEACDNCPSCKAFLDNNHPDIIEMDAARNNGVDNIREIVEQVNYAPILGKYKVYIIDEVHMLSDNAFNALLKTLEEPPEHVIFILATTDPEKIIPTVLSRCQRYNFSKISKYNMKKKMIEILEKENLSYEEEAIDEVAIMAEGGMRDALSILEQILAYNDKGVFKDDVLKIFGLSTTEEKIHLLTQIHSDNISKAINDLRDIYQAGGDVKRLAIDLLEIIKEALIYSDNAENKLLNKLSSIQAKWLLDEIGVNALLNDIDCLKEILINNKTNQNFLTYLELAFIKMSNYEYTKNNNKELNVKKAEPKVETKKAIAKETIKEEVHKKSEIKEENIAEEIKEEPVKEDLNFIASILVDATKEEKQVCSIIYEKLNNYKNEVDKRKYYEILNKTELFASNKDAIIVLCDSALSSNINSKYIQEELYTFILNEFNINKVIYAISNSNKDETIRIYREMSNDKNFVAPKIKKPKIKKAKTVVDNLRDIFGEDLKVE